MRRKPSGLGSGYAAQFNDSSIVAAYDARPAYPEALVDLLANVSDAGDALELGCGTGELSRRLAPRVRSVLAVDCAQRMIDRARTSPGGDARNIRWIVARVEDAPFLEPFSVVFAAESFHWFEWDVLCPRLAAHVPDAPFVLVEERREVDTPWRAALERLIPCYSTNRDFEPYDIVEELTGRGYLRVINRLRFRADGLTQTVDDYVRSIHSRNGFSLDRMVPEMAEAFDRAVLDIVVPHASGDSVRLDIETRVTVGRVGVNL